MNALANWLRRVLSGGKDRDNDREIIIPLVRHADGRLGTPGMKVKA